MQAPAPGDYDYIVVGSGAGGGTVAARLAEAGMKVLLLEAGSDPGNSGEHPELAPRYDSSGLSSVRVGKPDDGVEFPGS